MESGLIDDLRELKPGKETRFVRIISGILFPLVLVTAAFCYTDIVAGLKSYASLRGKLLVGTESLHGMACSFFIASLPVIAYNCHIRKKYPDTILSYLFLLLFSCLLFVIFLVLGMEVLFFVSKPENPLLPGYIAVPPFSFYFDLMFIFASFSSFFLLRLLTKSKKPYLHKQ